MSNTLTVPTSAVAALPPKGERRRKRRAGVSLAMRVRPADPKDATFEEVRATLNASRDGFYFITPTEHYYEGMPLRITVPYGPSVGPGSWEDSGDVVRVERRADGRLGVAVLISRLANALLSAHGSRPPLALRPKGSERRLALRYLFLAPVEVVEPRSGIRLSARVADLSLEGCYIDTLNPLPMGTTVQLRLLKGKDVFETQARVSSCRSGLGMGLAFGELAPNQRSVLVSWLAELDTGLELTSEGTVFKERSNQPAETGRALVAKLIRLLNRKGILSHSEGLALLQDSAL